MCPPCTPMPYDVVIAGGGPTGLMLAAEFKLAGVDALIVERRATRDVDGSRAGGLLSRSIEILDQRGIAERFIEAGQIFPMYGFGHVPFDVSDMPSRHSYVLSLPQAKSEPMLAAWALDELGVAIMRERDVTGFTQHADGVAVVLDDGTTLHTQFLVGCDGGRSTVRKTAGFEFVGHDPSTSWMIAEGDFDGTPELGMKYDDVGAHAMNQMDPAGPVRFVITEPAVISRDDPTDSEIRAALERVWGTDFGLRSLNWTARFSDATRQATSYRMGRVFLAGDAAHIHSPQGGQGMGTGMQDAVNLGWKLGAVVRGDAADELLDTYTAERHPVAARVLRNTMAQSLLNANEARNLALREVMSDMVKLKDVRHHLYGMLSALDIHYDLGSPHPLVGRRMPDLDLASSDGATRVYELLHDARHVLLTFGTASDMSLPPRTKVVEATTTNKWELPIVGTIDALNAVLIRPDGYVAAVGVSRERLGP